MNILPKMNRARIALVHDTVVAATSFPLSLYLRVGDGFYIFWGDYIVETSLIFAAICAPVFLLSRLSVSRVKLPARRRLRRARGESYI